MAKDVDLSSKEWRDLIFEGKNQEFGAYQMRKASDARHNKAMIVVVIIMALALILPYLVNTMLPKAEADIQEENAQQMVSVVTEEAEEEPEEEIERIEEQKPEALPEEILNTVKVTELAIVDDDQVKAEDEIKTQDELQQTETAFGQTDFDKGTDDLNVVREHKEEIIVEEKKEEQVFTAVEQMPQFPGGEAELMKYISNNIKYPTMAMENNIQGRVVVQFVVTKTGKIGEVKVVRSKDPDLDKEAVRVVKSLPNFIPGKMNGQAVNVWYTLPITFKLQGI
ncbi:MAG: energy transducer TonB [Muribaculaceae bacterium]|nr:energy transducer TonB [Muribaculaceae bacterium]MBQ9073909.1 energy transducer TonB [Muribaculaceae bacterium]